MNEFQFKRAAKSSTPVLLYFQQLALAAAAILLFSPANAQTLMHRIIYSRSTQPMGTVWLNNGQGVDSLLLGTGNLAKVTKDGRYILFMQNTVWNNPAWLGNLARYGVGDGSTFSYPNNSDYLVGFDMLLSDSSIVYDQGCGIYRMAFGGASINTLESAYCYGDSPSLNQGDSMVVYHNNIASLYAMHMDGSGLAAVPNTVEYDSRPTWSQDGQWVLFSRSNNQYPLSDYGTNVVNFFKIKANGDSLTALTNFDPGDTAHYTSNAVWSEDGQAIITSGFRNGENTLIAVRADGSGDESIIPTTPGDPINLVSGTADVQFGVLVEEHDAPRTLTFWPVPTKGRLHVKLATAPAQWQLKMIDAQGRAVMSIHASGPVLDVGITPLPSGVYEAIAYRQDGARAGMGRVVVAH